MQSSFHSLLTATLYSRVGANWSNYRAVSRHRNCRTDGRHVFGPLYPEKGPSWGCPRDTTWISAPASPDTLLTALERPFVHWRKGKVWGEDRESLQTDRDDVPRDCSTGQVFIAGSFVRIPLLINDYPNSMIDRQYRWLAALPYRSEFISYSIDNLIIEVSLEMCLIIYYIFCERKERFCWNIEKFSKLQIWK